LKTRNNKLKILESYPTTKSIDWNRKAIDWNTWKENKTWNNNQL